MHSREILIVFSDSLIVFITEKYYCRLDGNAFPSETLILEHIKQAHKGKIEDMLSSLISDIEEDHLGCFFTKMLYSDFNYSPMMKTNTEIKVSPEFPCTLAPDLVHFRGTKKETNHFTGYYLTGSEKKREKALAAYNQELKESRKEKSKTAALSIFSAEELLIMQNQLFGESFLKQNLVPENLFAVDAARVLQKDSTSSKEEISEEMSRKETKKLIDEQIKKEAKEAKEAAKVVRKQEVARAKMEQEAEQLRLKEEKEREELAKQQDPELEARREMAQLLASLDKKQKKQLEEELCDDLMGFIVEEFCDKLGNRTYVEMKKIHDKAREEEELRIQAELEREKSLLAAKEEERKQREETKRKDERRIQGERVTADICEETIDSEIRKMASSVLKEQQSLRSHASHLIPQSEEKTNVSSHLLPSNQQKNSPYFPLAPVNSMASSAPSAADIIAKRPFGIAKPASSNLNVENQLKPSNQLPFSQGNPQQKPVNAYGPQFRPSFTPSFNRNQSSLLSQGGLISKNDILNDDPESNLELYDDMDLNLSSMPDLGEYDEESEHSEDSNLLYHPMRNSLFSSAFGGTFKPISLSNSVDSNLQNHHNHHNQPLNSTLLNPSLSSSTNMVHNQFKLDELNAESVNTMVRAIPEEYGLEKDLCVVFKGLSSDTKRSDISNFLRGSVIAIGSDFSQKVQFLKGLDSGCCFVEMDSPKDVDSALEKNGQILNGNKVLVQRPQGILTTGTGQRYAFNPKIIKNSKAGPIGPPSSSQQSFNNNNNAGMRGLNPVAPEFRPYIPSNVTNNNAPGSNRKGNGLNQSLLNTENDAVVNLNYRRKNSVGMTSIGDMNSFNGNQNGGFPSMYTGQQDNLQQMFGFGQRGNFPSKPLDQQPKNMSAPVNEQAFMDRFG
eukprot:TRINITY_DN6546_c0_g1_i1.p1 TRINITY_DN6546_c0_g1~~TRINITY_DN6546_c0_g1_i1.p1  ORF type:complete len:898 (-),score=373.95 TRINITY_DN6546_c0_g1_i1:47-2740(-)